MPEEIAQATEIAQAAEIAHATAAGDEHSGRLAQIFPSSPI